MNLIEETIKTVAERGLENDRALLELIQALIDRVATLEAKVDRLLTPRQERV